MKDKNQYYDEKFIARWVSDELFADEQKEFEQWLLEAKRSEKLYFNNIRTIWQKSGKINIKKD